MGCRVRQNHHGNLTLYLNHRGRRWSEGTGLPDTKANRERVEPIAAAVNAEIKLGSFSPERYLYFFPRGNRADELKQPSTVDGTSAVAARALTIGDYYEGWIQQQKPPLARASRQRDYRQHMTTYVLDAVVSNDGFCKTMRDLPVANLRASHLRALQSDLIARGLAVKTARNIIDGSFRAMVREARVDDLLDADPFSAVRWPRPTTPKPDPFTEAERDLILGWFASRKPFYYSFVFTQFHVGLRPSEAVALRWGDVDTRNGFLHIWRSRYLGDEAATKTLNSERTIPVVKSVRDILRDVKPLNAEADDYVFKNSKNGGPIDQREWPKDHWRPALRATNIRHRKFYNTRSSFISIGLTRGLNLKFLSEYAGNSVAVIERSYGRFLQSHVDEQLALLEGYRAGEPDTDLAAASGAKTQTFDQGFAVPRQKPKWNKVSPTGFEPVSPA